MICVASMQNYKFRAPLCFNNISLLHWMSYSIYNNLSGTISIYATSLIYTIDKKFFVLSSFLQEISPASKEIKPLIIFKHS